MIGVMFSFEERFTYEDGTRPVFYTLMDGKPMPCLRFRDHYRPNNAHIFELGNLKKTYSDIELKRFREIFHKDVLNYLSPKNQKITFQNKRIKEILSYN